MTTIEIVVCGMVLAFVATLWFLWSSANTYK